MSIEQVDNVYMRGATIFRTIGWSTPVTLPLDGVLEIVAGEASRVVLANGSVLKGIRMLYPGDPPYPISEELDDDDAAMLVLSAEDGGVIFVIHNSLDVSEPTERINVSDGDNTVVDNKHVQIFSQYIPAEAGRRWRVNDWAGV